MTTVACVLRSGGHYSPKWVYALRRGLNRHAPDARLRILTDRPTELPPTFDVVRLEHDWPGWFSKVELWRPGLFDGPVIYLDLDTLVVGDLDELLAYDGPFAMLSDFYQLRRPASGVMAWTGDECAHLYERFVADPPQMRGRLDHWLERHAKPKRLQDLFPDQIVSLKVHARKGPPEGARLVCLHGQPRADSPDSGWVYDEWTSLAREAA